MITTIETKLTLTVEDKKLINDSIIQWNKSFHMAWNLFNQKQLVETEVYQKLKELNCLTSLQIKSIINKVKTEHIKIKELTKTQLKQIEQKVESIDKFINKEQKNIVKLEKEIVELKQKINGLKNKTLNGNNNTITENLMPKKLYQDIAKKVKTIANKKQVINSKQLKLTRLNKKIKLFKNRINKNTFKLCFGSSDLLKANPKNNEFRIHQNNIKGQEEFRYKNTIDGLKQWSNDWLLARHHQLFSVGSKKEINGNPEIQYDITSNTLRIRLLDSIVQQRLKQLEIYDIKTQQIIAYDILSDEKLYLNYKEKGYSQKESFYFSQIRKDLKWIALNNVEFNQKHEQILNNSTIDSTSKKVKVPITAKIITRYSTKNSKKELNHYLQLSFEEKTIKAVKLTDRKKLLQSNNINSKLNVKNSNLNSKAELKENSNQKNILKPKEELNTKNDSTGKPIVLGIDLNEKGLGYCLINQHGNKLNYTEKHKQNKLSKPYGFIPWDNNGKTIKLNEKSTEQREFAISNTVSKVLELARSYNCFNIAIENLDFTKTINQMNSGYKEKNVNINQKNSSSNKHITTNTNNSFSYNQMLSSFAKEKFKLFMIRKTARLGMTLNLVNPTYSSIIGYTKYGITNKIGVDTAASLYIARQGMLGEVSEKLTEKENNNYQVEHIKVVKKYTEDVVLPFMKYSNQLEVVKLYWKMNQPNKLGLRTFQKEPNWNTVSFKLGKNRKLWYKNLIVFIQELNNLSNVSCNSNKDCELNEAKLFG